MIRLEQCVVVIPCLNEAKSLRSLLPSVLAKISSVIVVDDGSDDGTAAVAKELGASVIRHETPQGKGNALKAGWTEAQQKGFTWVINMDGDGQHSPDDLPSFLEVDGEIGLVVGNRMTRPEAMPWLRRMVNRWMSAKLSRVAGVQFPDSQCGFRRMRLDDWAELTLVTTHYEVESEVLLGFAGKRKAVEFVPIEVIYRNEHSKIDPVRDTLRWFKWLWGR